MTGRITWLNQFLRNMHTILLSLLTAVVATSVGEVKERLKNDAAGLETFEHFVQNLVDSYVQRC